MQYTSTPVHQYTSTAPLVACSMGFHPRQRKCPSICSGGSRPRCCRGKPRGGFTCPESSSSRRDRPASSAFPCSPQTVRSSPRARRTTPRRRPWVASGPFRSLQLMRWSKTRPRRSGPQGRAHAEQPRRPRRPPGKLQRADGSLQGSRLVGGLARRSTHRTCTWGPTAWVANTCSLQSMEWRFRSSATIWSVCVAQ